MHWGRASCVATDLRTSGKDNSSVGIHVKVVLWYIHYLAQCMYVCFSIYVHFLDKCILILAESPEFTVSALMAKSCCTPHKVTCFKQLSQACIESVRQDFYTMSETAQAQKLLNYMREHGRDDGTILYTVTGQEVCATAFRMVYGLRYNRFLSIQSKYSSGVILAEHGRLGKGRLCESTIRAISWLRMFVEKVGDHMPMKEEIHLPSCLTKADVYSLAADDLSQGGLECCGKSTFYRIWQREFPHVKIPKVCMLQLGVWIPLFPAFSLTYSIITPVVHIANYNYYAFHNSYYLGE